MGGGNGCKSAAKREKNAIKNAAGKKGSQLEAQKSQKMRICKKCYTQYPYTAKEPELRTHCENKHPDFKFEQSFPDFVRRTHSHKSMRTGEAALRVRSWNSLVVCTLFLWSFLYAGQGLSRRNCSCLACAASCASVAQVRGARFFAFFLHAPLVFVADVRACKFRALFFVCKRWRDQECE